MELDASSDFPSEPGQASDASVTEDGSVPEADSGNSELPSLVVETAAGRVEGKLVDATRAFLGIPYAEAPVESLRFAPPRPKAAWRGTLKTQGFGAVCPQNIDPLTEQLKPALPQSEDCLTLNVFAPLTPPQAGAPVMVFFHGGGFSLGGTPLYDAERLSQAGDVVVVTVNYRLGALGFLAHPALDKLLGTTSGNMGLRDQLLSLQWVQENIAAFGGDPDRVTMFGESAGALSACIHMFMPESQGLARAFIMQSGSCVAGDMAPWTKERMEGLVKQLTDDLCVGSTDVIACLRGLPPDAFGAWLPPERKFAKAMFGISPPMGQEWFPHVDGTLLPEHPLKLLRSGSFARKPLIVGSNALEFSLMRAVYGLPVVSSKLQLALFGFGSWPTYDVGRLFAHYMPASDADADAAWIRMWSDGSFRCPSRLLAREAAQQGVDVYYYSFDIAPGGHAQELDYVFGWPGGRVSRLLPGLAPVPKPELIAAVQEYWTAFARAGVPTAVGQPSWTSYDRQQDENLRIAEPIGHQRGLSQDDCDVWDEIFAAQPL